jgi:hypothetical protein
LQGTLRNKVAPLNLKTERPLSGNLKVSNQSGIASASQWSYSDI